MQAGLEQWVSSRISLIDNPQLDQFELIAQNKVAVA